MRRHNLKPWAIEEPLCDINTTPMIDVMLVLITMLMLSLPPPTHEVPVDLPSGSNSAVPPPVHRLTLDAGGQAAWDGVAIGNAALTQRLAALTTDPAKPVLQMQTDAETPYARFDETIAMVKQAGVKQLGFIGNEAFRGL